MKILNYCVLIYRLKKEEVMENFKKLVLSSAMISGLTACGGESTPKEIEIIETPLSVSGKVIDGYVTGATVFLDMNFNGELDNNEPNVVSTGAGNYQLELSAKELECSSYVPLIVDVPVGAVDEDTGKVTEAYQMTLPPSLTPISDEDILNISPITTAIWGAIKSSLESTTKSLSCDTLLAQEDKREMLQRTLTSAIDAVVYHYNIAEADLFEDFISTGNDGVKQKAIKIVKGLKKSFKETLRLKEEHPDATWIRVNYHISDYRDGDNLYPGAWYRESYIREEGKTIFELDKVTNGLENKIKTIIYGEITNFQVDDFDGSTSFEFESRGGDDSPYSCDIKEEIQLKVDSKEYRVTNLISKSAEQFNDCLVSDFAEAITHRYAFIDYQDNDIDYGSQFIFYKENGVFSDLNNWTDFSSVTETLDKSILTAFMESLPYLYSETGLSSASYVSKSKSFTDGDNKIRIYKSDNGENITYTKYTTYPDKTRLQECSDDGETWGECS